MRYIIILFLLTNCTTDYPVLADVYKKATDWDEICERYENCQLHGKDGL